jgi:hypothetical protein
MQIPVASNRKGPSESEDFEWELASSQRFSEKTFQMGSLLDNKRATVSQKGMSSA